MFRSPSFNHITLDLCSHNISFLYRISSMRLIVSRTVSLSFRSFRACNFESLVLRLSNSFLTELNFSWLQTCNRHMTCLSVAAISPKWLFPGTPLHASPISFSRETSRSHIISYCMHFVSSVVLPEIVAPREDSCQISVKLDE